MVHEDIEELRRFGEGVKQSSKRVSPKDSSSQFLGSLLKNIKKTFHSFYLQQNILSKKLLEQIRELKNTVLLRSKIRAFNHAHRKNGFYKFQRKGTSSKQYTRLIETKKQIGNTTIIIRKRVSCQLPRQYDQRTYPESEMPSLYFFHERFQNRQATDAEYGQYESLFDIPIQLDGKKPSIKDKMKLFFVRS